MTTTPIPTGPTPTGAAAPSKLLIALIAVGGVLLLAVVAIVFLLIGQNSNGADPITAGDQTPTPTISETPATPTAEPEDGGDDGGDGGQTPVDNSLRFTSFNADLTVECDPTGQAEEKAQPSDLLGERQRGQGLLDAEQPRGQLRERVPGPAERQPARHVHVEG